VIVSEEEMAASIIQPYFDAVRHTFSSFVPDDNDGHLKKLARVRFVVDPDIHDTPRHFAATRDDGIHMMFAPQIVDLSTETLIAIIVHEFGHAADFSYPGRWVTPPSGTKKAIWIPDEDEDLKQSRQWKKLWNTRGRDQIEWAADGIAFTVTGMKLEYCGDCMLQCFSGGTTRPKGLR
jgi:hypothetical protein